MKRKIVKKLMVTFNVSKTFNRTKKFSEEELDEFKIKLYRETEWVPSHSRQKVVTLRVKQDE